MLIPPVVGLRCSVCPVTDLGLFAFQFALHDPTQTNIYVYALWISPVTVPGCPCLPLTHTRRPIQCRWVPVDTWADSLSSNWLGCLGPSRSQLSDHTGLPVIQPRPMWAPTHGSQASYPSYQLIQLDVCRGAYTDIHPCAVHSLLQKRSILPQSKIILPALAQITPLRWTLQRPLEQELPFTYSIKWDLSVQCNVCEGGSSVLWRWIQCPPLHLPVLTYFCLQSQERSWLRWTPHQNRSLIPSYLQKQNTRASHSCCL